MGPLFRTCYVMVLEWLYKNSESGAHTRGSQDLLWIQVVVSRASMKVFGGCEFSQ